MGDLRRFGEYDYDPETGEIKGRAQPSLERVPKTMMWVRTKSSRECQRCEYERKGLGKETLTLATPHDCGELQPAGPMYKDEVMRRKREAQDANACRSCFGAGFVWAYGSERDAALTATGVCRATDQRGTRYLVPCGCRERRTG